MSENGEIYTAGKKLTLPPAVTAWTNLTSGSGKLLIYKSFWLAHWSFFILVLSQGWGCCISMVKVEAIKQSSPSSWR